MKTMNNEKNGAVNLEQLRERIQGNVSELEREKFGLYGRLRAIEAEQSNRQEQLRVIEVAERLAREFPNSSEVTNTSALPLKPNEIDKTTQEGSPLQESSETLKGAAAQSEGRNADIPREKEIQEDLLDALRERLDERERLKEADRKSKRNALACLMDVNDSLSKKSPPALQEPRL